jgi:hypothetical protein
MSDPKYVFKFSFFNFHSCGIETADYCSISFKSTLGVMHDPKNQFDISTTAKIWRDTTEIFDIKMKILAFLGLTGNFEPCVMLGRFDKWPRDA